MKKLGIKYKLRIITLIPVFLVALLFAVFYNNQYRFDINEYISRLGEANIRQLLPAAQFALMKKDTRTLQSLINASTINPEVQALAFYNAQGQLLAYRGGKHFIDKPFKPPTYTGDYIESKKIMPYTINFLAPITIPKFNLYETTAPKNSSNSKALPADDILGWLSINIDTQSTLIKRYRMYIITIFITLIGLLLSLTIHYFLSRQIYIPISRLRRAMKQILANEFETRIPASNLGELGIIEKGCAHLQKQYLSTVSELNYLIEVATSDLQQSLELLEEKNVELVLDKKKCEEKSKQKSEFIANMSHEIRTPMNGVIGFTNVLLESKLDSLQMEYVKTIKSSAQNLLSLITDILDYSKIDAGKLQLDCIPVDIRSCIDEVLALINPTANKKQVDLIPITDINVSKTLLGDPLRIKQILTNLVSNAVKFTDQGYVLIRTSIEQETDKDYTLCISVSDTGIGISNDDQTRLFNAFNQADITITRRFGGTGLGLVICKKLVEEMGGRIKLNSEQNKGSTFTALIKLEKPAGHEIEKNQSKRFANLKVLCFDENPLYLEALCNGLGFFGINCISVSELNQLKKAFKEHSDSAFAFINVNEGYEKQIAEILQKQKITCILVSKWLIHNPKSLGASAFLFKPINIQKLQEVLETINNKTENLPKKDELEQLRAQLRLAHPDLLIAEDNPVNRLLLNSLLSELTTIEAVDDGEKALNRSKSKRFNLIILDLQMPKINGLNVARLIRQESTFNKKTPIVVISANLTDLNREELQKNGIDLYLQKPVEEKKLLKHLLELLEKSKPSAIDWQLCMQKVSGKQAIAEEFLARFVDELKKNRREFFKLFKEKDLENLAILAHQLHGACGFSGVPKLQERVVRLEEKAIQAKTIEELKVSFSDLIQSIDEVIDEYNNLYV